MIVLSTIRKDLHLRELVLQAYSYCQIDLQKPVEMTAQVVLLLNQRARRCFEVERLLWQMHCFHWTYSVFVYEGHSAWSLRFQYPPTDMTMETAVLMEQGTACIDAKKSQVTYKRLLPVLMLREFERPKPAILIQIWVLFVC